MVATNRVNEAVPGAVSGWVNGLLGVIIFSGSLPATRIAVQDMNPLFLTFMRASIAGVLAIMLILLFRQQRPRRSQIFSLVVVALGVVIGFPLLTAIALQHITSAHSIVFLGLLPLATAIFGVLRGGERPRLTFWLFSAIGSLLVSGFALTQSASGSANGDLLMLASVVICGLGYAEGAKLSRELGGWQVISWALIISLPLMLIATFMFIPEKVSAISVQSWLALGYVSLFSMLIGFIFWYKGLAAGGIASVGQLQLLQPFFGLALSAWLLSETVTPAMLAVTLGVILCVIGSRKFAH
ncbi:DMT family transporter [Pantoea piersonii]|jgi:drug/metabolite transporter (DMT)-like permease|uniref:DMT family transporter n=1 Tax=Pantoea piersonii TaxID=2364647 RepID=UPI000EA3124D|nr:DMT family transporter [Pantoea piersonii]MBZ6387474.1 DMT family transporter [Pantoea piersonii]MBZ6400742.1 DMT family transporter [Pantoea piersonii]MBZ6408898.1 DMT family transporter [Pantoea piersonii]MBZ6427081.1 DMT family transporter [Pantoea piersonii]NYB04364.1 DMT family transporter [Pantoea piersonii]